MINSKNIDQLIRDAFYALLKTPLENSIEDMSISDLNIDSLEFFELIVDLEEAHGISIPIESLDGKITLSNLISSAKKNN
jgi:acyl carrier protein